jgi:hypothetical protein
MKHAPDRPVAGAHRRVVRDDAGRAELHGSGYGGIEDGGHVQSRATGGSVTR